MGCLNIKIISVLYFGAPFGCTYNVGLLSYFFYEQCFMRNDICTTTLSQLFDNFLSHTHIIFLFSLFLFLSLLF